MGVTMGIIYSEIYKNHFPLKERFTEFTEQEKKSLCHWANIFRTEVYAREIEMGYRGCRLFPTYNLNEYDEKIMVDMINQNCFDDRYLAILNAIIYRHKYNAVLSICFFPMLKPNLIRYCMERTRLR